MSTCIGCKAVCSNIGNDSTWDGLCPFCMAKSWNASLVKIASLESQLSALRAEVVPWRKGGKRGESEPIPEPEWGLQLFILGTLEFSKTVELFHVEYGHRLQWVYKTPDMREWQWSDIVKWCPLSAFPLPKVD